VVHHVATKDNYNRNKHPLDPEIARPLDDIDASLVIWRDSDVWNPEENILLHGAHGNSGAPSAQSCGHDRLPYNTNPSLNPVLQEPMSSPWGIGLGPLSNVSLIRRDDVQGTSMGTNFAGSINQTAGCPTTQKVLYMGVAADCIYTSQYGSRENATTQILNDWNTASSLYKSTFNISLGIVELQVSDSTCPNPVNESMAWNADCSVTLNDRLSLFSQWRGDKGSDGTGLWHLMSGCPTGSEVGIAWLATLCQQTASGSSGSVVSGTAVSTAGRTEWQVVAHEIGHNFGAIHDCVSGCNFTTPCCPSSTSVCDSGSQFLMSPTADTSEKIFSPCSLGNICSLMQGVSRTNTTCLLDPDSNVATISLQMCGNGIVESGEDCDPGEGVDSPCCDSSTCKFKNGAVCDPASSPCCTQQCSFAPSSQVCRPSIDPKCDIAEKCTGNSSSCPSNVVVPNGQSCGAGGLACASGQCTSVDLQCQTVGTSLNLTKACPNPSDSTCQVSCQDPTRSDQCILLTSLLIDGSPCGYGGMCSSGKCQTGNILDTAKAWYVQNLQISIPVTIVAGLAFILLLWALISCTLSCCRRRKEAKRPIVDPALRHERLGSSDRAAGLRKGPLRPLQLGQPSTSTGPPYPFGSRRSTRSQLSGGWAPQPQPNPTSHWVDAALYNGR